MRIDKAESKAKKREIRAAVHMATDWSDPEKFAALFRLGCKEPQPFIDRLAIEAGDTPLMIRCRVTGECFTAAEARGEHPIPGPAELIERRNAIRDGWTLAEMDSRDCTQPETIEERDRNKQVDIQFVAVPQQMQHR